MSDNPAGKAFVRATVEDDTGEGLASIRDSLGKVMDTIGYLVEQLNAAVAAIQPLIDTLASVAIAAAEAVAPIELLAAAGTALVAFATANPVIAAVAATLLALYAAGSLLEPVMYALGLAFDAVMLPINLLIGALKLLWAAFDATIGFAIRLVTAMPRLLIGAFTAIGRAANALQKQIVQTLIVGVGAALTAARAIASSAIGILGRVISNPGKTLVQPIVSALTAATDFVGAKLQAIGDFFSNAGRRIATVGASIAGIGALIVGPLTAAANEFAKFGGKVEQGAREAKLTVTEFMELSYAAKVMGTEIKKLDDVLQAEGIAQLRKEAAALGQTLTPEQATTARKLAEAFQQLKTGLAGIAIQAGAIVAPAIREATDQMVSIVKLAITWIKENKELIATVFKVASAVASVGAIITTVGGLIAGVGSGFGVLAGIAAAVSAAIAGLGGILVAVLSPMAVLIAALSVGGITLAAWLNPLELVRAALTALGPAWSTLRTGANSAITSVMATLGELSTWFGTVMSGIWAAITAQNPGQAVTIAMAAMKVALVRGLLELSQLTQGVFGGMFDALGTGNFELAFESLKQAFAIVAKEGLATLAPFWTGLLNSIDTVATYLHQSWNTALSAMARGIRSVGLQLMQMLSGMAESLRGIWDPTGAAKAAAKAADAATEKIRKGISSKVVIDAIGAKNGNDQLGKDSDARADDRNAALREDLKRRQEVIDALKNAQRFDSTMGDATQGTRLSALQDELNAAVEAAERAKRNAAPKDLFDLAIDDKKKTEDKTRTAGGFGGAAAILAASSPPNAEQKEIKKNTKLTADQVALLNGYMKQAVEFLSNINPGLG